MMEDEFYPIKGAEGWQLSNAPVLGMAAHLASLKIFKEAGMSKIGAKRDLITAYLEFLLEELNKKHEGFLEIITPKNPAERGSQLSILFKKDGKEMFNKLTESGVVADWREPNVIRIAPAPLYVSYEDCWFFADILNQHA
jgi:kynureninase